jgi:hypothetical protein
MGIPITYFRSSSFGAHKFCPMRYFMEYTLGWRGKGNKKADKGTIVHKVMEILAGAKQAKQNGKRIFKDTEIADYKTKCTKLFEIDEDELCDTVFDYYSGHFDHHEWTDADRRECRRWSQKVFDFQDGKMDPRNRNIVEPEQHFDIELKYDWAKYKHELDGVVSEGYLSIKGTIDLVTQVDDSTYEVVDWKTGARKDWNVDPVKVKEYDDFYNDAQLRIYHLAICELYPDVENIWMTIYFINDGGPYTIFFSRDDIPETLRMIREKYELIKTTDVPERHRTWKCSKFCHQGTTTFEEEQEPLSPVLPIIETRPMQVARRGNPMSKCDQCNYYLTHRDMKTVVENMTFPGHDVSKYTAPGSTS